MEYSFTLIRKISRVFFIFTAILLFITLCGIGGWGLTKFFEDGTFVVKSPQIDEFVIIIFLIVLGLLSAYGAMVMIIKKPLLRHIVFNEKGIADSQKGIFISWDDVKKISIIRNRISTHLVISAAEENEKPKGKVLSIEWRKELTEVMDEFWQGDIPNYRNIRNKNDSMVVAGIVFECLAVVVVLVAVLIYF